VLLRRQFLPLPESTKPEDSITAARQSRPKSRDRPQAKVIKVHRGLTIDRIDRPLLRLEKGRLRCQFKDNTADGFPGSVPQCQRPQQCHRIIIKAARKPFRTFKLDRQGHRVGRFGNQEFPLILGCNSCRKFYFTNQAN